MNVYFDIITYLAQIPQTKLMTYKPTQNYFASPIIADNAMIIFCYHHQQYALHYAQVVSTCVSMYCLETAGV